MKHTEGVSYVNISQICYAEIDNQALWDTAYQYKQESAVMIGAEHVVDTLNDEAKIRALNPSEKQLLALCTEAINAGAYELALF